MRVCEKSSMSTNLPIDVEHLHQISEGDTEFELELLQVFVEDTQEHIAKARLAISLQDYQLLSREAHHMKGSSGNVGSHAMQALAHELENLSKQQSIEQTDAILVQLEQQLLQVQDFMKTYA